MAIRKDANTLSPAERAEFVAAVLALKAKPAHSYDRFVLQHANAIMSAIHQCPAFLPWHRQFILDYEHELQQVSGNPNLGLPYWNWPSGGDGASMWHDDLLGGNGESQSGAVGTGPFRSDQWTIVNSNGSAAGPLVRRFGEAPWATSLPTQDDIDEVLRVTPYDVSPWNDSANESFRNHLEGWVGPNLHNRGHGWVGGSMLPMTSPNDPVFFMHHCMVDKIWYEWQLRFPNQGYLPQSGGPFGQNLMDVMNSSPSGTRPVDVWDSEALGIAYDRLMPGTPAPGSANAGTLLTVDGGQTSAEIGVPGEMDLYRFEVPSFGTYLVQTVGSSDTVMVLSGPNDLNLEVASDDDGGVDLNAKISRNLSAGTYYVRVRLFDPTSIGAYRISVHA